MSLPTQKENELAGVVELQIHRAMARNGFSYGQAHAYVIGRLTGILPAILTPKQADSLIRMLRVDPVSTSPEFPVTTDELTTEQLEAGLELLR